MEISDDLFLVNRDWDPVYLNELFREDFFLLFQYVEVFSE